MKRSSAYSVYLLFRFSYSLLFSMATVLSIVYHLEVVRLDPFQLVLVGTVLESSCFLFELPTGVVADLYSRRRSVLIGVFLYGIGFLIEGALPWFWTVLLAQVVWGCGDTFITGALEAWIASEEQGKPMDKVFLRGGQLSQLGSVAGIILGTLLGNISLQLPIVTAGILCLLLDLILMRIMPETNFSPALEENRGLLRDLASLFKLNFSFVKGTPVLLALLAITLCGGLASEGFDRLSTVHFLEGTGMPVIGMLNSVTWFGAISLMGNSLGILVSQLLIRRMERRGTVSRTALVLCSSIGYILCLLLCRRPQLLVSFEHVPPGRAHAYHTGARPLRLDERPCGGAYAGHRLFHQRPTGRPGANHRRALCWAGGPTGLRILGAGLHRPLSDPGVVPCPRSHPGKRARIGGPGCQSFGLQYHHRREKGP